MSVIDTLKNQIKVISLEDMQTVVEIFSAEANRRYRQDKKLREDIAAAQFNAKMEKRAAHMRKINEKVMAQFNAGR